MNDERHLHPDERAKLAKFLLAVMNIFKGDAEVAGLPATARAIDEVVSAISVDLAIRH